MKTNFVILITFISLIMIGCSTTIGGAITPELENYHELCGETDDCFKSAAMYNKDITICEEITDESMKEACENILNTGEFTYREYTQSERTCSYDSTPFVQACEEACNNKNMDFRRSGQESSVGGQISCEDGEMTVFIACYCY